MHIKRLLIPFFLFAHCIPGGSKYITDISFQVLVKNECVGSKPYKMYVSTTYVVVITRGEEIEILILSATRQCSSLIFYCKIGGRKFCRSVRNDVIRYKMS